MPFDYSYCSSWLLTVLQHDNAIVYMLIFVKASKSGGPDRWGVIVQSCLLTEISQLVVPDQLGSEIGYFQFLSQVKSRTSLV